MFFLSIIKVSYINLMGSLFEFNLFFLTVTLIFSVCVYYGSTVFNFQNLIKNFSSIYLVRSILMVSLVVSFFIQCYIFWLYLFNFSYKITLLLYQHDYTKIKWNVLYDVNILVLGNFNFSFKVMVHNSLLQILFFNKF